MVETPEGHVESVHKGGADLPRDHDDNNDEGIGDFPHMREEHLRARHQELEEAWLKLDQERANLEQEIAHRGDSERACARAREVNQRIVEDDRGLPRFARASQNIGAIAALL